VRGMLVMDEGQAIEYRAKAGPPAAP
jgi:hypothetical protein